MSDYGDEGHHDGNNRDLDDREEDGRGRNRDSHDEVPVDTENFNIYVTQLSRDTTDASFKAAFEAIGEVREALIIREPITQVSRGFGFVSMMRVEDGNRALVEMDGFELDGKKIKVEKARRKEAYAKTPGQYLGPPGLSSKYKPTNERGNDRRDSRRGDSRDRGRDRDRDRRDRSRSRDRDSRRRDDYDRYPPRDGYRGGGGYGAPRVVIDPSYYPRAPLLGQPQLVYEVRPRSPMRMDYPRGRSPPPRLDDHHRGPPPPHYDSRGPPPAAYAANAYYSSRSGPPPRY